MFTSTKSSTSDIGKCLEGVETKVTTEMNELLLMKLIEIEVKEPLMQMGPLKSPGFDGFNADFYQSFWPIVKEDVSSVVFKFLNEGSFDSAINHTHVLSIPKIKNPTKPSDFRPISLYNVFYKLV